MDWILSLLYTQYKDSATATSALWKPTSDEHQTTLHVNEKVTKPWGKCIQRPRASNVNGKKKRKKKIQPRWVNLHYLMPELPGCLAYYRRQMGTKALCNYSASPVGDGGILRELSGGFHVALTTYQLEWYNTCCSLPSWSSPSLFLSVPCLFSVSSLSSSQSLWNVIHTQWKDGGDFSILLINSFN